MSASKTIRIKKCQSSRLTVLISLRDPEWMSLAPENIASFQVQELLRPCSVYPDGLFPGAILSPENNNRQVSRVYCFPNYLEWSRVTNDDVADPNDSGTLYLTSNFFEQRKIGWAEIKHTVKPGTTVGYCFNGTAYSIRDKEAVRNIVYQTVYKSIIKQKAAFKRLYEIANDAEVELTGSDLEILQVLAETLSETT